MLRHARPLLVDALREGAAASGALPGQLGSMVQAADGGTTRSQVAPQARPPVRERTFRPREAIRKPLSDRYDIGGYPHPPLNTKYASLVVGEHFGRVVFDRRSEMMAVLSATNLIRETIAGAGRILITSNDRRMEAEILACARDCGEFTHSGKWPPGGFTNRPQVSVVPILPSLVIALEHDNHVLMREAFQMCIPRVAPVDVYNNKADFTPEVPLHAAEYTLHEKRRMLQFFTSFIAKLKYGQMPVGDTQGRYKEFTEKILSAYQTEARDIPEPYVKAAQRPHDSRPDLQYGVQPAHVEYNAQRALEESQNYHAVALQPSTYMDAAATEDDIIARDLPSIESYEIGDTVEYSTLTDKYAPSIEATNGVYVRDFHTGELVEGHNQRDFEHEELLADDRARREAGVRTERQWNEAVGESPEEARADALSRSISRMPDAELREQYEQWYKDRQDQANDFIPFADETEPELSSKFSQPSEKQAQDRLWKLKTRVRENQAGRNEKTKLKKTNARLARGNVARPLTRFAATIPFDATGQNSKFSTLARSSSNKAEIPSLLARSFASATKAPTAANEAAAPAASIVAEQHKSGVYSNPANPARFPRWLLPGFLLVPIAAYMASLNHTDEETKEKIRAEQQDVIEIAKQRLGLATTDKARKALESDLSAVTAQLTLLLEARAFVLSSIPESERHEHQAVLTEVEERKTQLEQQVAQLKQKLGKK